MNRLKLFARLVQLVQRRQKMYFTCKEQALKEHFLIKSKEMEGRLYKEATAILEDAPTTMNAAVILDEWVELVNGGKPIEVIPKFDTVILHQAITVCGLLCGIPVEIVPMHIHGEVVGYRMQPDLKMVEVDLQVHDFIKQFAKWYMEAHQHTSGIDKIKAFTEIITAIHDFNIHWQIFCRFNPELSRHVIAKCTYALQALAKDQVRIMEENKKAGR